MSGPAARSGRLAVLALALAAARAAAQLEVACTLEQTSYVLGEPIRADVRIVNHGSMPYAVADGPVFRQNGLFFEIRNAARDLVEPLRGDARLIGDLLLEPGKSHDAAYELDEWYPLRRTGRYFLTAQVRDGNRRYDAATRAIDVVPGIEMRGAVQLFGDRPDEQRRLTLVYWMRRQAEFLFLRATDSPGERVLTTVELGQLLRTTDPTIAVTPDGEVTVVHRATRDVFLKTRVRSSREGVVLLDQERILDAQSVRTAEADAAVRAGGRKPKVGHWWWPFGGSGEKASGGQ
jgi:hypothetical protein